MQPLLDGPRAALDDAIVTALLTSTPALQISYGCARLTSSLVPLDDITEWMSDGSSIDRNSAATVQGSCKLLFDTDCPLNYLAELAAPYMVLTNPDTGDSAQFNLGVYSLQSPSYDNSAAPTVQTFQGYDLNYLLNQELGDSYLLAAGADPLQAMVDLISAVFPGAAVTFAPTAKTPPKDMVWASGQQDPYNSANGANTYLTIVNDVLNSIGYAPLWVDWDGAFQMMPYVSPTDLASEWSFDLTDEHNIVAEARTSLQDTYAVPNYWQFIMTGLTAQPVEGVTQFTYIDTSPRNITSTVNRPFTVRSINFVNAVDYDSLVALGVAQITLDLAPAETFAYSTSPFPLAWQYDQIQLNDPNLVTVPVAFDSARRVQALQWSLPLDGQTDMDWVLMTVPDVGD